MYNTLVEHGLISKKQIKQIKHGSVQITDTNLTATVQPDSNIIVANTIVRIKAVVYENSLQDIGGFIVYGSPTDVDELTFTRGAQDGYDITIYYEMIEFISPKSIQLIDATTVGSKVITEVDTAKTLIFDSGGLSTSTDSISATGMSDVLTFQASWLVDSTHVYVGQNKAYAFSHLYVNVVEL